MTALPVELNVTDIAAQASALTLRASGTVDRCALGLTPMPGMAGRLLAVELTVHATRA